MRREHYILDRAHSGNGPVYRIAARQVANRYQSAWRRGSFGFKKWLRGGASK